MRVISGKVRGLKLNAPKNDDVRPTTDRVKESLFNMINSYMMDSDILDLVKIDKCDDNFTIDLDLNNDRNNYFYLPGKILHIDAVYFDN